MDSFFHSPRSLGLGAKALIFTARHSDDRREEESRKNKLATFFLDSSAINCLRMTFFILRHSEDFMGFKKLKKQGKSTMSGQIRSISKKGTSLFTTCQVEKIGIFNNLFLQKNAHLNVPFFKKGKNSLKRHPKLVSGSYKKRC